MLHDEPSYNKNLQNIEGFAMCWGVFRAFVDHVPGQKGVWTPPRGLSTAIFGDSLQDLTQKRADVDMWTAVSLLIIERRGVHISWGALGGAGPCKDSRRSTLLRPPLNLGGPFWCPRSACLKYGWMEVLQSSVGVDFVKCVRRNLEG